MCSHTFLKMMKKPTLTFIGMVVAAVRGLELTYTAALQRMAGTTTTQMGRDTTVAAEEEEYEGCEVQVTPSMLLSLCLFFFIKKIIETRRGYFVTPLPPLSPPRR